MSSPERELTIRGHLEELRRRLFISAIAVVVATVVAFVFHRQILELLKRPIENIEGLGDNVLVFTEVTEFLGVIMKVSLLAGLVLALPVVMYQVVMFVAPGLTPQERRYLFIFLPGTIVAFVAGILFGYFVLFPPALRFLLTFGGDVAVPMIRIGNYMNLMITLLFWMGVVFETPFVMFFLARLGVVSARQLARFRRFAVVGAFILGAIITPTFDPVNQTLVALPIIVLYELGIHLAKLAQRSRRRSASPSPQSEQGSL